MKKNILRHSFLTVLAAATLQGCIEDSRENYMVDDTISLAFDEQVIPVSAYEGSYTVTVLKAGKGKRSAWAELKQGSEELATWNADGENDATYSEISSSLVSFSQKRVTFSEKDVRATVEVSWDPRQVVPVLTGEDQVIPVAISGSDLSVNPDRGLILLNILNSSVSFASTGSTVTAREMPGENNEVSVKLRLDHPLPEDLTIRFSADNSLVDTYNAEKGTEYVASPDGLVPEVSAVIPAGASDVFATLKLDNSKLWEGGEMMHFRTMVIPLRIKGTSLDGVILSDAAYYLLVNNPNAGASYSRVWGLYSPSTLWTQAYGLPSGADRNLALDQDWVYLPYAVGGATARITALSLDDPETTKTVNTTGFTTATITSACVRVIDKGDGTQMLVASGAGENTFPFYAWENGIDNPPTVFTLECTWRRGGDRFEFHGSWKDGILYVHAYQGRFATRYKVVDGQFVSTDDGRFNGTKRALVDMTAGDTGFGGFHAYPGQDQMVFTTSDVSAFITMKGSYNDPGDGQKAWETAREDFPGADMTWGYRVFTFQGEKYIAYTQIDKNDGLKEDGVTAFTTKQRARLVIVKDKGGFKASLLGDNKDIVFEAPLQGENFEDIAAAPPASAQGDCAVIVVGSKVYIAAGVQGIGVSLFKIE